MIRELARERADAGMTVRIGREAGLSLVELMISITLGFLVVMAATALFLSAKSGYTAQDENARIQETGRYAIEAITRAVRQASYENWDRATDPIRTTPEMSANIGGLNARSLKAATAGIESPIAEAINGSDVLAVRFFGAGAGDHGDNSVINCAGFGVPGATSSETAADQRGWSIFYVAKDASGEPELYCKYRSKSAWTSQAIARGVESFQVLYGLDSDGDGLPNRFLSAAAIDALDDALKLDGADAVEQAADRNRKTNWKKVAVIRIALLVRGAQPSRADDLMDQYDLFGKDYADAHAAGDSGTRIREADLPKSSRNRARKVFSATIQLRNQPV